MIRACEKINWTNYRAEFLAEFKARSQVNSKIKLFSKDATQKSGKKTSENVQVISSQALSRANKFCKFFPCHARLEDCTFCYCPFYPCKNENRGEYIYSSKTKKNIWSCEHCNWIHKKKVVDKIYKLINESYSK